MSIRQEYFDLLAHVGTTSTVAMLAGSSTDENRVAMRHDVDHDLELALEMAHHEWVQQTPAPFSIECWQEINQDYRH